MKLNALALVSALAFLNLGMAQEATNQTTNQDKSWYQELKDSPWSLSVLSDTELNSVRTNHKLGRADTLNIVYVGYKLSDVDSLRLENRHVNRKVFSNNDGESQDATRYMDRTVFQYRRSSILTEAENGVDMSASVDLRYRPNAQRRSAVHNHYGLIRPNVVVSKSFGKAGLSASGYYAQMFQREANKADTAENYWYLITGQSYSFTDKFSMEFVQEWFFQNHSQEGSTYINADGESAIAKDYSEMILTLQANYQVHPQIGLSTYTTHTDAAYVDNSLREFTVGFTINASVF